jgi:hypothetical protein
MWSCSPGNRPTAQAPPHRESRIASHLRSRVVIPNNSGSPRRGTSDLRRRMRPGAGSRACGESGLACPSHHGGGGRAANLRPAGIRARLSGHTVGRAHPASVSELTHPGWSGNFAVRSRRNFGDRAPDKSTPVARRVRRARGLPEDSPAAEGGSQYPPPSILAAVSSGIHEGDRNSEHITVSSVRTASVRVPGIWITGTPPSFRRSRRSRRIRPAVSRSVMRM